MPPDQMKRYGRNEEENYNWIVNVGENHVAACEAESGKEFRGKKRGEISCENKNSESSQRKKDCNEPEIRPVISQTENFEKYN